MSSSDPVAQALRLFSVLTLLASRRSGQTIGRAELAQACHCSTKTIQRDLDDLKSAYIPIEYDPIERTYLLPDKQHWTLPAASLNSSDALALALVRAWMAENANALPFAAQISAALDKVTAGISPVLQQRMHSVAAALSEQGGLARDYSRAPLETLANAITRHQTLEVLYDSRSSGECSLRQMDPLRLDRRDGRYLDLQAWCHKHKIVRTFALDRMLTARPTGRTFEPRAVTLDDSGVVGGLRSDVQIEVVVRFDKIVAAFARERNWSFAATFTEAAEGSVIMRGKVQGVDGMVRELLSWRRHATVLGGPELRAAMREEVGALSALYALPLPDENG